jgi:hypothetical protein
MSSPSTPDTALRATHAYSLARTAWLRTGMLACLVLPFAACDDPGPTNLTLGTPGTPDTTTPPTVPSDTVHGDSVPLPDPNSPPPPPPPPSGPVTHVGIPFGPAHIPPALFAQYSGTIYTGSSPDTLLAVLDAARRANARLYINLVGNESNLRDANGFNFDKWKARVDRFRGIDLTPYIDDGTISAHFIMDEPQDPTNWNGHPVTQAQIEEMAAYSKQLWPTMPTMIRSKLEYLKGFQYPHLDAVRIHYVERFGPIDAYIASNVQQAKALGLAMVGGLNVLNGGSKTSGIPGKAAGKNAMNADEIRSWGRTFLAEPYICGFLMYQYDPVYLARPDIQSALSDLAQIARNLPTKACRP